MRLEQELKICTLTFPEQELRCDVSGFDRHEKCPGCRNMERFTYSVTDLADYESEPVTIEMEAEEAIAFAVQMAREVRQSEPLLELKGMCVALFDSKGKPLSIVPLDTVH